MLFIFIFKKHLYIYIYIINKLLKKKITITIITIRNYSIIIRSHSYVTYSNYNRVISVII